MKGVKTHRGTGKAGAIIYPSAEADGKREAATQEADGKREAATQDAASFVSSLIKRYSLPPPNA